MGILSKLFGKEENEPLLSKEELLDGSVCPNCWGEQAYDDKFKQAVLDQTKSNINHDKFRKKAFVQQFIETSVTGIKLKQEGEYLSCPKCSGKYKHVSTKIN